MQKRKLRPTILVFLCIFFSISTTSTAMQYSLDDFDTKTLRQAIKVAIANLELRSNIEEQNKLERLLPSAELECCHT